MLRPVFWMLGAVAGRAMYCERSNRPTHRFAPLAGSGIASMHININPIESLFIPIDQEIHFFLQLSIDCGLFLAFHDVTQHKIRNTGTTDGKVVRNCLAKNQPK
jgi:hypothetical protein